MRKAVVRPKGVRQRGRAQKAADSPLEPLAIELFGVVRGALTQYGLSPAQQRRLFQKAQRSKAVTRASDPLLLEFRALGDLVATWREDTPYVDATGKPRVLDIKGRGATFEALCKQFLPDKSVEEVVALACRTTSVGTLAGGRIALYGDTLVDISRNQEGALAQTICHITRIFDTCLHNVQRVQDDGLAGRLERLVNQEMSPEDFERFQQLIRPQLHDICERVDRMLQLSVRQKTRKAKKVGTAGMGIYVYYDGEMKHVRRGRGESDS